MVTKRISGLSPTHKACSRIDDTKPQGVKLLRGKLEVNALDANLESIQSHLKQWYRSRAKVIFEDF
jgi:hypothetical protein